MAFYPVLLWHSIIRVITIANLYVQMRLYRMKVPLFVSWSMLGEHIDQVIILINIF